MLSSLGVCCSSWIVTSRGSTGRCWICPMGLPFPKVLSSNKMVSRIGCIKKGEWFLVHKIEDLNWSCHWPIANLVILGRTAWCAKQSHLFAPHITVFVVKGPIPTVQGDVPSTADSRGRWGIHTWTACHKLACQTRAVSVAATAMGFFGNQGAQLLKHLLWW